MPKLPGRLRAMDKSRTGRPRGLGPGGPNPLFLGVCAAIALAAIAAITASADNEIVQSNLVHRLVIGGIVFAIAYAVVVVLWLAWHRRALKKLGIGPASGETPDLETAQEVSARDDEIREFMETATNAIAELDNRLAELEKGP